MKNLNPKIGQESSAVKDIPTIWDLIKNALKFQDGKKIKMMNCLDSLLMWVPNGHLFLYQCLEGKK